MKGARTRNWSNRRGVRPRGVFVRRLSRLLAFVAGILWGMVVYYTPALTVQNVQITGTEALPANEIRDRLDLEGRRLLALDVGAARAEIAKEPWVKSVEVRRRLPDTVLVQIQERKAFAMWRAAEQDFLVDAEGVVVDRPDRVWNLPLIVNMDGSVPVPGDTVEKAAVSLAVSLAGAIPERFGMGVRHFEYRSTSGLAAVTENGRRAGFGSSEEMAFKLDVWQAMQGRMNEACPTAYYVDLRFGYSPFFRCI